MTQRLLSGVAFAAALLASLLATSPAGAAQAADPDAVEVGILDVLLQRGLIDQSQYEELLALARSRAEDARSEIDLVEARLERLRAPEVEVSGGAPGKLEFRSPDGSWSMKVKGWLQARYEQTNSDDSAQDTRNFSVPRARIGFEGNAGSEDIRYRLELDAATEKNPKDPATSPNASVRHAYVDMGLDYGARLLFGQTKFPFGREMLTSAAAISFAERSIASEEFSPNYEPLAMLHGIAADGELEWFAAMSNGEGRGKNNTPGDATNGTRKGVRAVWNPLGAVKADGPAFQTVKDGATKASLGASWMRNDDSSGLNTPTAGSDTSTLGLDAQLFSGPLSLLFERFDRHDAMTSAPDTDDSGWTAQAGCFLDADARWELVVRRSVVDYATADDETQTGLGLNWYRFGHAGQWQLDYDRVHYDGSSPDDDTLTLQCQVMF